MNGLRMQYRLARVALLLAIVVVRGDAQVVSTMTPDDEAIRIGSDEKTARALSKEYESRYGLAFDAPGIVAVFPLTALGADSRIRVSYRQVVKGASAIANCKECLNPIPSA
jgi:hypothetical protein